MRITIHFDFKPSVTIIGCEVTLVTFKKEYVLIKVDEEYSNWDLLMDAPLGMDKKTILALYNDGTCSIEEKPDGYYKITGMSAIEVAEKEFND
jgi:hypothetical protein